jgi:hypothetical protein
MLLTKCPHHVIYDLVFLTNPETVQLIRAALKHLPPDERAIITMFPLIPYRVSGFCLRFYLKRNNFLHKSFVCIVFFVYLQHLLT